MSGQVGHVAVVTPSMVDTYLDKAHLLITQLVQAVFSRYMTITGGPSKYPGFDIANFGLWAKMWDDFYKSKKGSWYSTIAPHALYHEIEEYLDGYNTWHERAIKAGIVKPGEFKKVEIEQTESGFSFGSLFSSPIVIVAGIFGIGLLIHELRKVGD